MESSSNAVPAPAPEAGAAENPQLTVVPSVKRKRRSPSMLNQQQARELARAKVLALVAAKPEYGPTLESRQIPETFVAALLQDIQAAQDKSAAAVEGTGAKEGATQGGHVLAQTLVHSLRGVQAAARQMHAHVDPTKLQAYFIGERITANQPTLDQAAQGIIAQASQERPPGVDTDMITRLQTAHTAYTQTNVAQAAAQGRAKQERQLRDGMVESIKTRRRQIQFAADAAWPSHVPANAQARKEFRLPAHRPFTG